MGKIVSLANQKGGVGKTTTCVNMSAYLSSLGNKTLLIDLDPQGSASTGLGVDKKSIDITTYNVLIDDVPISQGILSTNLENLFILPASVDLAGAEVDLVYQKEREFVLKKALDEVKEKFDYIMIDCPPSLGLLSINALTASNSVLIPVQSEYYALEGLAQLLNSIKLVKRHLNPDLQVEGVAITMCDGRSSLSKEVSSELKTFFGDKVFNTSIPRNVRLAEAPSHGVPISLHDKNAKGAKAYLSLTKEFLEKQTKTV